MANLVEQSGSAFGLDEDDAGLAGVFGPDADLIALFAVGIGGGEADEEEMVRGAGGESAAIEFGKEGLHQVCHGAELFGEPGGAVE